LSVFAQNSPQGGESANFQKHWIRALSLIGSSGGLIIKAHTVPYLFCHSSSCAYNSHMRKRIFLHTLRHSQFLCSSATFEL